MEPLISNFYRIRRKWARFTGILLLLALYTEVACPNEIPIITLSVGGLEPCPTAYIIKIFEDGLVQYKGVVKVKAYGRREARIGQKKLNELLGRVLN